MSLDNEFGFQDVLELYQKNIDTPLKEWLEVEKIFPRSGKQGLVGVFRIKNTDHRMVFKVSQYINYLVQHELLVLGAINKISKYCPHFCRGIGGILADTDPNVRKDGNPFEIKKQSIEKEVLLLEHIDNSTKFYNYIKSDKIPEEVLFSTIHQTLFAISIAQRKTKFTHYDLHSNNVIMKKCDPDLVFLYVMDEQNQFYVPSFGHRAIIIDFGFSYADTMDNEPLWPSLGHTDVGFWSHSYDPFFDPRLFLVTVSSELVEKRGTKKSKILRRIVKNIFGRLSIDWHSGWDKNKDEPAADYVLGLLDDYNDKSELFEQYDYLCIDIIQTLVNIPLKERSYKFIDKAFKIFINEFSKIEREVGNAFYCLYLLKWIVDTAREIEDHYINPKTRQHAVNFFQRAVYEGINSIVNFCQPKDVNFEKMLCGLLNLSKSIGGVMYNYLHHRKEKKDKDNNKLPVQSIEQMSAIIEENIPHEYTFTNKTKVMVIDCTNEITWIADNLSEDHVNEINKSGNLSRGNAIYNLISSRKD